MVATKRGQGVRAKTQPQLVIDGAAPTIPFEMGYAAGSAISKTPGVELIVRTEDGRMIPVVQEVGDGNVFQAGQVVAIVQVSGRLRVQHL